MLKDKNFDYCLIGKSYLSYLFSLFLQEKGKKVLLLDDSRVRFGPNWSCSIGEMEKHFLQLWGKELQLPPLENLDRYLAKSPTYLFLSQKRIKLGQEPRRNLQELLANTPELFLGHGDVFSLIQDLPEFYEKFNNSMLEMGHQVAEAYFQGREPRPRSRSKTDQGNIFEQSSFPFFSKIFANFCDNFYLENSAQGQKEKEINFLQRTLIYLVQAFWQGKLSDYCSEWELYHIMVSFFTPRYKVLEDDLIRDLHGLLQERGIFFKSTQVESFQFVQGRLNFMELKSFEGVIHPQEVFHMGTFYAELPFRIDGPLSLYFCINFELHYPEALFTPFVGEKMIFSPEAQMGTEIPLWTIEFSDANSCHGHCLFPQREGDRPDFYFSKCQEKILQSLSELFPHFEPAKGEEKILFHKGQDEWVNTKQFRHFKKVKKDPQLRTHQKIREHQKPGGKNSLLGLHYRGPLQGHSLGLLSFLHDLRHSSWKGTSGKKGPLVL